MHGRKERGQARRWRAHPPAHCPGHGRRWRGGFLRERLRHRLVIWFGVVILGTGLVVGSILFTAAEAPGWRQELERWRSFGGELFAERWDDPRARDALARLIADELDAKVTLLDASGVELVSFRGRCSKRTFSATIVRAGVELGTVHVCPDRGHRPPSWAFVGGLLAAGVVLWLAAGALAHRLMRPLDELVEVAQAIGEGDLDRRMKVGHGHTLDLRELAETFNQMAARIQKQLADQRELLAAVSHEVRTPLGHLRILLELAQESGLDPKTLEEMEREVAEIDALVDQLLASSRLELDHLDRRSLDPVDLARRALGRKRIDEALLEERSGDSERGPTVEADATLLARALANLLDNAIRHGGGPGRLVVELAAGRCSFAVEDDGPGFADGEIERVFDPFYRGEHRARARHGSLGLGLSLVDRIARAHGGEAFAENRPEGGARVGFSVPV